MELVLLPPYEERSWSWYCYRHMRNVHGVGMITEKKKKYLMLDNQLYPSISIATLNIMPLNAIIVPGYSSHLQDFNIISKLISTLSRMGVDDVVILLLSIRIRKCMKVYVLLEMVLSKQDMLAMSRKMTMI